MTASDFTEEATEAVSTGLEVETEGMEWMDS